LAVVAEANIQDPFGLVGTTLEGQYRIDQVVGEGGFGVVYRGWHVALEQPIAVKALKVLADDRAVQDALFAKFKDEAKLLYTLSQASLHIVRSMDFGAVTSPTGLWAPYMVLEWLAGRSLADDLTERRRRGHRGRSLDEALALLEPAAEGLAIAHHRRVAHRDIKPANFFLLDGDEGPRVKVLDFGIAKIIRDGEGPGTRSPFASFTWLYAAPEQLDPRLGQSGLATDVYSFALLLTELLTDRVPTDGRDVVSLLKAAVDPTVRPTPRHRGAIVPDAVEVVCRRALAVDPKARFATIGELWGALTAARRPAMPLSSGQLAVSNLPPTTPAASGGSSPNWLSGSGVHTPQRTGSSPPGAPPMMQSAAAVGTPLPYAPTFMQGVGAPSQGAPLTLQEASALSPPRMTPPPGTRVPQYPLRRMVPSGGPSALPVVLAVIGLVIGLMFVATCAAVHAAC
jgi:serine/threonine-protein kinase